MRSSNLFIFLVTSVLAVPNPHNEMLDTPGFRAVGIAFQEADYKGESIQLVKSDVKNRCFPVSQFSWKRTSNAATTIGSVKICKPEKCALFTGLKCTDDPNYNAVLVEGPVDVPNFDIPAKGFQSYICGDDAGGIPANDTIHSKHHNATA